MRGGGATLGQIWQEKKRTLEGCDKPTGKQKKESSIWTRLPCTVLLVHYDIRKTVLNRPCKAGARHGIHVRT